MASRSDISGLVWIGDDLSLVYTIYVGSTTTPQDITGWSLSWKARMQGGTTTDISKATGGSGIVLTVPASGIATVTLNASETALLTQGIFDIHLRRTDSGFVSMLSYGFASFQYAPAG